MPVEPFSSGFGSMQSPRQPGDSESRPAEEIFESLDKKTNAEEESDNDEGVEKNGEEETFRDLSDDDDPHDDM